MGDALTKLDAEISAYENRLAGLRLARSILADAPAAAKPAGRQPLLLEGPKPPRQAPIGGTKVYDINDVNVEVTERQFAILQALFAADSDWVPHRALVATAGSSYLVKTEIGRLRDLLKPARARIDFEPGSGYRIVTDD